MTNEMKLLTALCDALGFDVERVCVNQDVLDRENEWYKKYPKEVCCKWWHIDIFDPLGSVYAPDIKPIYEYKITKRGE